LKVRRNTRPTSTSEVEDFVAKQPNMPQNEYMERFAKQYVSSTLYPTIFFPKVEGSNAYTDMASASITTSARASASHVKATTAPRRRRITAAYARSCTPKSVAKRRSR
jgi:hypothetical protein